MSVNAGERHIADTPSNRMFYAVDEAKNLAVHTIQICANESIFLPKYIATTSMLRNIALQIYENAWLANNVKIVTAEDWKLRREHQKIAAAKCNSLLAKGNSYKLLQRMDAYYKNLWR
jgi:hypothetical protein